MNKKVKCVLALLCVIASLLSLSTNILAATETTSPSHMGKYFERIYDKLFGDDLDPMFDKYSAQIQLRVKTGIVIVFFTLIFAALSIMMIWMFRKPDSERFEVLDEEFICEDEDAVFDDEDDDELE